jgi:RNA polymerase sigma-70 factor, ECF subfamily
MAPAPDDAALIGRIRAGDQEALNALLVAHYDRLYAICRRMTGNDPDALDATQDALMAIVAGLDRYDGRSSFRTWAYRVATNACLDQLRRSRRRPTAPLDHDPGPARAHAPGLDQAVTDRLVLDDALATLPPAFRAAVVLRDVIGLDYAEIAAVLDVAPGTVRSRIARGRAALADQLDGNRPERPGVEGGTP